MLPGFGGHLVSEAFLESRPSSVDSDVLDRVRRDLIAWRRRSGMLGPASSLRAMLEAGAAPLVGRLGFDAPASVDMTDQSAFATLRSDVQPVALVVVAWGERLDSLWRPAVTEAMRRGAAWALLFNGVRLRIVDARRLFARRYSEFDLDVAIDEPDTLAALWTVVRGTMLSSQSAASLDALVAAADVHASGVCRSLRDGVLSASAGIFRALACGARATEPSAAAGTFEQALTIVYRILFLLFAEARSLVPVWHPVYRDSYSLEALREAAERPGGSAGLWDTLQAIGRLAHAGCRAGDLRVTPFNGRLFAPARTPLAERQQLDDDAAKLAVLALATRRAAGGIGRERIAYRDLGVEQLGAVYETLLDYQPVVSTRASHGRGRAPHGVTLAPGSGVRKTTGTFYTPQSIAEHLVRHTLAPLVDNMSPEGILQLRIVDPAMGSGAFLVAACHYLGAAYEAALVRAGGCHPADVGEHERAMIRRSIAERCLYGVDVNPMAVQLARLSLWLTTLAADRPLSFLDHRLQVGDSLLGTWLSRLHSAPPSTRSPTTSPLPLFEDEAVRAMIQRAVPSRFLLESIPNDTIEQVRSKERTLATMSRRESVLAKWKRVADLWCACWFSSPPEGLPVSAFSALSDAIVTGSGALPAAMTARHLEAVDRISRERRFFHWELEFPEVFFDAAGSRRDRAGFDAVIGNPPWDMVRADAGPVEARGCARADIAAFMRFVRGAGIYQPRSSGHLNRYQLFLERAMQLIRPEGRLGLVLPAGLATDQGSAGLRRRLLTTCDVDTLVGFDNRRGVFPIHRGVSFLLVTAQSGRPTRTIACRVGLEDPAALHAVEAPASAAGAYPVKLSLSLLQQVSGDDLTIPLLRTPVDVAIVERAAALFPPLGDKGGWSARFGRELNATDDRGALGPAGSGLPVVAGKMIEPFRVNLEAAGRGILAEDARRLLPRRGHEHPRLAYRDVAGPGNRLTLIATVLPSQCVSTHTVFCLQNKLPAIDQHFLCGLFNSFVLNYLVRTRVSTHVTTTLVERLPVPGRERGARAHADIAALARLLARRFDASAYARLQALVARMYQLSPAEFGHVLSTFPLIPETQRQEALRLLEAS